MLVITRLVYPLAQVGDCHLYIDRGFRKTAMREIHETTSLGKKAKSGSRNIAKHRLRNQNHVKIKQQQQNKQIKQQKIHVNEVKTRNAIARLLSSGQNGYLRHTFFGVGLDS